MNNPTAEEIRIALQWADGSKPALRWKADINALHTLAAAYRREKALREEAIEALQYASKALHYELQPMEHSAITGKVDAVLAKAKGAGDD